ncbi:uncharacterized protein LOC143375902 isoform X1 [Andrena cerasifolii]|uniref:uncharacterized protein LOC143375902 isoform X1 n=1 Tax=Andrena cerasifolii TaxID=2819439 RepID=UPI0040379395
MESFDDDMFALSDEELPIPATKWNAVEEHLAKQLGDVRTRIVERISDINEVQDTKRRILKSLQYQAQYGENATSDSDSNTYNIDGQPVVKKEKRRVRRPREILVVQSIWKRVVCDKWVIGVVLQNTSTESQEVWALQGEGLVKPPRKEFEHSIQNKAPKTSVEKVGHMHSCVNFSARAHKARRTQTLPVRTLCNPQFYVSFKGVDTITGTSTFWSTVDSPFWYRIDTIKSRMEAVATVVLDLPAYDTNSFCDAYGTISYNADEREYQTPIATVRLLVGETISNSCGLKFSTDVEQSILALKSMSMEKTVGIQIEGNPGRGESLLAFLGDTSFKEICADVYALKATGSLMYCLVEILPIIDGEARLRIFSRCDSQMNIILRLLRDQFPDMTVQESNKPLNAAIALVDELKMYLEDTSDAERQMARIKTDLLIQ